MNTRDVITGMVERLNAEAGNSPYAISGLPILLDAYRAEVLTEAADLLAEIGTPIHGTRSEHERSLMYGAERLRRMADETAAANQLARFEDARHTLQHIREQGGAR
ncbi:hypothetical protein ABT115_15310 [Streptomyces sp. NPDC001832]|uniref:hypothetical protein n=1 Tax=Streptomyces sp. NPDC001832 TaxID=3154527 RepID=UPI003326E120